MKFLRPCTLALAIATLCTGCEHAAPAPAAASTTATTAEPSQTSASAPAAPSAAPAEPQAEPAMNAEEFGELVKKLSEPDAEFFSDNFISNETSYLQVAGALASHEKGGAYVGVGPEQNFTYIALLAPEMAYIVDIRRDNMVLHLLYKAAFELATSRAHFLALLTGREYAGDEGLADDADIDAVIAHAERGDKDADSFREAHAALIAQIKKGAGLELDDRDLRTARVTHRAFWKDGLDLRFTLKEQTFRKYPSLRELISAKDAAGEHTGFLGTDEPFRHVQRMHRENRIVPLVGDFAGSRAMPALAAHMADNNLTLRAFYVSNVEQYLMVDGKWWKWQKNVAAFPVDEHSLFIRCYLDQGKPHPAQMQGHRTTTTLHPIQSFNARKKPYPSMFALASDNTLPLK